MQGQVLVLCKDVLKTSMVCLRVLKIRGGWDGVQQVTKKEFRISALSASYCATLSSWEMIRIEVGCFFRFLGFLGFRFLKKAL